jgi:Methyltransferase domain
LSAVTSLKFFDKQLNELEIINALSDIKHRIFPRPFERLYKDREKTDLIGIEIGVAGGEHSLSLLETLNIKKLYCIDPYSLYENYFEGKTHFGIDQAPLDVTEMSAHKLLQNYQDKIVWIKNLSQDATHLILEKVDFVYIDGNHAEDFVTDDIDNYYPLVKKGGVIGGHDFYNGFQSEHDGVISSVMKFCVKNNLSLKVELPDWWIVKP